MFGDFNTGPNAPRKRSRVAQGIHIGKRRSIPNARSMRIFGCFGTAFGIRPKCRHADNAAMAKGIRRNPMCRARTAASIIPMAPQRCAQAVTQDRLGFIPQHRHGARPNRLAVPRLGNGVRAVSRCRAWVAPSPTPPQSRWKGNRKQKIGSDCNFFAIRDCYGFPRSRIAVQKRR